MNRWVVLLSLIGVHSGLADAAFVDVDPGLIYPQQLAGMHCQLVEKYDNEALGYTLFYDLENHFEAEVSVYDLGLKSIETGYDNKDLALIFDSVESRLNKEEKEGRIANIRKRNGPVIPAKGDFRFANQVFQYSAPRLINGRTNAVPRINSVYATAAHNNFIKVEFRFDVANGRDAGDMAQDLLLQLIKTFKAGNSEEELLLASCDALVYNPSDYAGRLAGQHVWARAQTMGELNVYTHLFVWPDDYRKPKNADLLTAAYFAGMLKTIIPQKLESGGEAEGFEAMLQAYANMRVRDDIEVIPQLDEWGSMPDKKALFNELLYTPVEQ